MKPLILGILLGLIFGFVAACFFLYSFWMPITAVCILICAIIAKLIWKSPIIPSLVGATLATMIYFAVFWLPPEVVSRTATSPIENARAASLLARRGQIFGNESRAFEHYEAAAEADHLPSLLVVGNAYLYGHYGRSRDSQLARKWLERAKELGSVEAEVSLENNYHYPKAR